MSDDAIKRSENDQVRIVLRPYASTVPLATFAFGVGNVLFSAFLLHWIPQSESLLLAVMLLAFAAPLELFPCVMAFLSRDAGGATAFGIFGASWVVQGVQLILSGGSQKPSIASGIFLLLLSVCLAIIAALSFSGKPLFGVVLVIAVVRTVCAGLLEFGAPPLLGTVAAWVGLLLGALAFYAGVAFLHEDISGKLSPLTFRSGKAKQAMEGSLSEQLEELTREAGVRKQL